MPARTLAEAFVQARTLDAPLGERLDSYAHSVRKLHPPLAQAVNRLVERLNRAKAAVTAPKEGDLMPPFFSRTTPVVLSASRVWCAKGPRRSPSLAATGVPIVGLQ